LRKRPLGLPGSSIDPFELARVRDVMDQDVPTISANMKLAELTNRLAQGDPELNRRQGTLIVDDQNRLVAIITRGDIVRALRQNRTADMTVTEAGTTELTVAYPDEPLHAALTKMQSRDIDRLPVVDRKNPTRPVGYLGRAAILSARMKTHKEKNIIQRG
jgi:CBS domain-containing protein